MESSNFEGLHPISDLLNGMHVLGMRPVTQPAGIGLSVIRKSPANRQKAGPSLPCLITHCENCLSDLFEEVWLW
jgi:hypothetical protein